MTYSRRQTVEERNNRKKAIGFTLLSIGAVLIMFFYGLPLLVKLASFVYDIRKGSESIEINDKTPPPPPRLDSLDKATNKEEINVEGNSEPGAIVEVDINGAKEEVVVDDGGRFSITIKISKGDNFIKAVAKDSAGNVSNETQTYTIVFDNEPPEVEITSPENNAEYYGSKQKTLTISGKTETNVKIQINDRLAIVDHDGNFSYSIQLNSGVNNFTVKATDEANNTKETVFQVNFTP